VTFSNLKNADWDFLDVKMINKLDAWISNSTILCARLIDFNLVYLGFSLIIYLCSSLIILSLKCFINI
jgi:hypothetical protein